MGYRSNGGMAIFGPEGVMTAHLTMLRMTQTNPEAWGCAQVRTYVLTNAQDQKILVWRLEYEGWKWYADYPDIQEFERIYRLSEEAEDQGICGFRWRIGEDDTDIGRGSFGDHCCGPWFNHSAHDDLDNCPPCYDIG